MGNNQKMPLNSSTCLFFSPKKDYYYSLYFYYSYVWLGLLTYPPQQPPKACKITMEAMAERIEQNGEARLYKFTHYRALPDITSGPGSPEIFQNPDCPDFLVS
jgi:hypothetical protein